MEVEILVAEVGTEPDDNQLFHILYDGTVMDETRFTVLGGEADAIAERLEARWEPGMDLGSAIRAAAEAIAGPDRQLTGAELEVSVLARGNGRRAFRRIDAASLAELLGSDGS